MREVRSENKELPPEHPPNYPVNKQRRPPKNEDEKRCKIKGFLLKQTVRDAGIAGSNPATPTIDLSGFLLVFPGAFKVNRRKPL
jgi:hypothetical protein